MKRFLELGEMEVWAHWTLLPAALLLVVAEGPGRTGLGLLALLLHETGHLLTARGLGYRVRSLELWPFGAALSVDLSTGSRGALPVALAGPLCSMAAAAMSLLLLRLLPRTEGVMEPFFCMNLSLAAVNLLPAEPLDGGRALASLLSRPLGARRARRATALLFAAFLLLSGVRTIRGEDRALEGLLDRQASLRAGRPVEVREAALMADRTAGEALRALRRGRYTLIRVVDRNDRLLGTLDEGVLLRGLMDRGEKITLGELFFLFDR